MRRESLARGAVVLAAAGIVMRIAGFVYRVPLARWIGAEGLGIYQMAQPAYHALLALSVGGIPTALANLAAEYGGRGRQHVADQVLHMCLAWVCVSASLGALTLIFFAGPIAAALGDPRAEASLLALAPAVLFFALGACYRGYLHGRQLMTPTALAGVLEQLGRVGGTLVAAAALLPLGLGWGAAGAAFGASVGAVASLLYLVAIYHRARTRSAPRGDPGDPPARLRWRVFKLAWPLTLGALVLPGLSFVDVALIQRGLQFSGLTAGAATALYGQFSGMVYPLVTLPAVLSGALAHSLLPVVAAAWARGDTATVRRRCLVGLRATAMLGLPAAMGLIVLARPILQVMYGDADATQLLRWSAAIALLNPLAGVLAGALQGLGHTGLPVRNFTLAMVLKVALDAFLARVPGLGIQGVAAASVAAYGLVCLLNIRDLETLLGEPIAWNRVLAGPLLASSGMAAGVGALIFARWTLQGPWGVLATALFAGGLIYALLLGIAGAITRADLRHLASVTSPRLERWLNLWPF